MYFIFFYLYGSHDQLEQRNDRVSALLSSKQRAPGRKGLHGDGAASGGRLRAAVVLSTQPEGDRSRTPSEATSNGDRGEPLVPPRTGSRRTLAYSSAGPSTAWNDADARLCAGSFQLDPRDALRWAGLPCASIRQNQLISKAPGCPCTRRRVWSQPRASSSQLCKANPHLQPPHARRWKAAINHQANPSLDASIKRHVRPTITDGTQGHAVRARRRPLAPAVPPRREGRAATI